MGGVGRDGTGLNPVNAKGKRGRATTLAAEQALFPETRRRLQRSARISEGKRAVKREE